MFFFKNFVVKIIIPQTNLNLQHDKHRPTTYGEFLRWIGLWFLMATINGPDHCDFWSLGEVDCFVGAPMRLHNFMSRKHFEAIPKALAITARQPPAFRDRFWVVRDRIPSTTPGVEPPRDAKDSGSARSHPTHLETSSSNRPEMVTYTERHTVPRPNIRYVHTTDVTHAKFHARNARTAVPK